MLFSIITCTYNPYPDSFEKLIYAVDALRVNPHFSFEWLIVDNGSRPGVSSMLLIRELVLRKEYVYIIDEQKKGLTNARITGINKSKGSWILFLDDDNEPHNDYLINLFNLISKYQFVKCWGPGNVYVTHLSNNIEPWIVTRKDLFQEKHIEDTIYSNQKMWNSCCPAGTGMALEKNMLTSYIDNVKRGIYTLTDRLGRSLSSGGDTQIVFHVVRHGMHVGLSPDLRINHNIEPRKTTFRYLKKQVYGGCKSFVKAHNEVLTENRYQLVFKDNLGIAKRIVRWVMGNYKRITDPTVALDFFGLLGSLHSSYFVVNRSPPILLRVLVHVLVGDK